jgi:hypothetical protein
LIIEKADGFLSLRIVAVFDKCEAAFSTRLTIEGKKDIQYIARTRKMSTDILFSCFVGKVPNKKTNRHSYLVKTLIGKC